MLSFKLDNTNAEEILEVLQHLDSVDFLKKICIENAHVYNHFKMKSQKYEQK